MEDDDDDDEDDEDEEEGVVDEEEDDEEENGEPKAVDEALGVRRRNKQELAKRVEEIKRNIKKAERWHILKRTIIRSLTITAALIVGGLFIYRYFKQ